MQCVCVHFNHMENIEYSMKKVHTDSIIGLHTSAYEYNNSSLAQLLSEVQRNEQILLLELVHMNPINLFLWTRVQSVVI